MRITDQLARANEDLLRFEHALPKLLRALRDALPGQPGAASYDAPLVHGHTSVLDELGVPMPAISDPTGEAATDPEGPAAKDLASLKRHVAAIGSHAEALYRIHRAWSARPPTDKEKRETALENERPSCEVHARAGLHCADPDSINLATIVDGWPLPKPMRICKPVRRRINDTHRIPSSADVQHFEDRGRWPSMLDTNYRGEVA